MKDILEVERQSRRKKHDKTATKKEPPAPGTFVHYEHRTPNVLQTAHDLRKLPESKWSTGPLKRSYGS